LVLVGSKQPLERALARIRKHQILSLPVVDESSTTGAVIGLLTVLDIVAKLSESTEHSTSYTARPQRRDMLFSLISEIMQKSDKQPAYLISTSASLFDAVHHFATTGMQRLMIVDRQFDNIVAQDKPEEMVVGMLTQSDVVRFVAQNFMWMRGEPVFQRTLRELNIGNRKPIIVNQSILAYQAFLEIHKQGCDGIALIDSTGKLIANISASNIKGLTRRNYQILFRPLSQYLARDRNRGWWHLPVCTTSDTKLETVILQFVATKVHRMYITNDEGKPVGEVSLTDVMSALRDL
jgi:CBS-domain-containing membrane protein